MRKKIAIYTNGWNNETLQRLLDGIRRYSDGDKFDIFVLTSYATGRGGDEECNGQNSVFELADMKIFDGIIITSNNLNAVEDSITLGKKALASGVPTVTVGMELEGLPCVGIDNDTGMRVLVEHLIECHNAKKFVFVGGPEDHHDSNQRLKVTKEVLSEHGIELEERNIFYAGWVYSKTMGVSDTLIDRGEPLPDAIVCANDYTAIGVIARLDERGYCVPDDVIVTGVDCIGAARYNYPSITSVKQAYEEIGMACCDVLFGDKVEKNRNISVDSEVEICESCGCDKKATYERIRNKFCTGNYAKTLRMDLIHIMEKNIEGAILSSSDFSSLKRNMCNHYRDNHLIEGNDFYIVLYDKMLHNILEEYSNVYMTDDNEDFSALVALRNGEIIENATIEKNHLIPNYIDETKPHTYHVSVLHWGRYVIGYIVVVDYPWLLEYNESYLYNSNIKQSLQSLRINMRLDTLNKNLYALYNKDSMTGLYNRFGFENLAVPLFEQSITNNKKVVVCFLDINYMKKINDVYGHLQGDMAISLVADGIKANEREEWIAIRYGGDEFLVIAACDGVEDVENVKTSILENINIAAKNRRLPYEPSVSCGYVIAEPGIKKTLQEYIKEADDLMYEIKRKVHANDKDK